MPTAKYQVTNMAVDDAATYKAKLDANSAVGARIVAAFHAYEATPPDMTVKVAAGGLNVGGALVERAIQAVGPIAAPTVWPRIDRVVIDARDGTASVVAGAEAANPAAPEIPVGKLPVAQIALTVGMTQIANAAITDERTAWQLTPVPKREAAGNCTLGQADFGRFLNLTAAATVTLDTAGMKPGWWAYVKASTGTAVLDPAGGVTIDGAATVTLSAGSSCAVIYDGAAFFTVAKSSGGFEAGTTMLFVQSTAPVGWTKSTTHNDKALRVVSGAVGSGGSVAFSTVFARTATDGHTLTVAELASHGHGIPVGTSQSYANWSGSGETAAPVAASNTGNTGGGGAHSHNIDLRVQYVDAIIAIKD